MFKVLRSSAMAVGVSAVVLAGCAKNSASPNRAMNDDLKRDLQLASSSSLDLASQQASKSFALTEIGQSSAPAPATTIRKAAGPKAVRSKAPTVKAAPEPTPAVNTVEATTTVAVEAPAPVTAPVPDATAPAVPRPSPTPVDPNGGEGAHGQNGGGAAQGSGDGGGSILGTIFGAIIRGGTVDGDHCDPRGGRRGPPRGGVYVPGPYSLPNGIPSGRVPRM
ncbi:MAG: hypothetical protein ACJ796_17750 [Gemmatimonadaceae bacterium]